MASLYAQYIKERDDKDIVEYDNGFATYKIYDNGECYLEDIYVTPDQRKTGLAVKLTDEVVQIAKEKNCKLLVGSVCVDDKNATKNMKIFLTYGMQIYKNMGTLIFLKKDISGDR